MVTVGCGGDGVPRRLKGWLMEGVVESIGGDREDGAFVGIDEDGSEEQCRDKEVALGLCCWGAAMGIVNGGPLGVAKEDIGEELESWPATGSRRSVAVLARAGEGWLSEKGKTDGAWQRTKTRR